MAHLKTLPVITSRQHNMLMLLYRFRFLTRIHIQTLLDHKNHQPILAWLKDLTEKKYILRSYDKQVPSSPAVYSLANASRKYLKQQPVELGIKPGLLDRVWREASLSQEFRQHCLCLADIYLSLLALTMKSKSKLHFYTKTDLHGIQKLIVPNPDAYFAIETTDNITHRYFLDLFDDVPPKVLRQRVRRYITYFESDEWQDNTDKPFPEIILICPSKRLQRHVNYYIQKKLRYDTDPTFYLSTSDTIKRLGLRREALQKVDVQE